MGETIIWNGYLEGLQNYLRCFRLFENFLEILEKKFFCEFLSKKPLIGQKWPQKFFFSEKFFEKILEFFSIFFFFWFWCHPSKKDSKKYKLSVLLMVGTFAGAFDDVVHDIVVSV